MFFNTKYTKRRKTRTSIIKVFREFRIFCVFRVIDLCRNSGLWFDSGVIEEGGQ